MEENQIHHIHLFRGITKPKEEFEGLLEAKSIHGLGWRIIVLSIVNAIVLGLIGFYATQNMNLPEAPTQNPMFSQGIMKGIAVGGSAFGGLFSPIVTMLIMAAIFLIFFSDIGYKKLFAVELYLQLIGLIGTIVSGILMISLHLTQKSHLNLDLGAITSLFTDNLFINTFFTGISIFVIWKLYVQIQAYRKASTKSASRIAWTLILMNIAFLLINSGSSVSGQQMITKLQHLQPPSK
ncbi:MAG TPA: YIP1 family protein [Bacillales bacterium]|nr:YIP1 family protein [Bacillales bacterium]